MSTVLSTFRNVTRWRGTRGGAMCGCCSSTQPLPGGLTDQFHRNVLSEKHKIKPRMSNKNISRWEECGGKTIPITYELGEPKNVEPVGTHQLPQYPESARIEHIDVNCRLVTHALPLTKNTEEEDVLHSICTQRRENTCNKKKDG